MADPDVHRGLLGGTPAPQVTTVEEPDTPLPYSTITREGAGGTILHYHFPVEIEVRAAPRTAEPEAAARLALRWLTEGLHSL
jgi:hypothetical protein